MKPSFGAGYPVTTHSNFSQAFQRHQLLINIRNFMLIQTTAPEPGVNPNNSGALSEAAVPLSQVTNLAVMNACDTGSLLPYFNLLVGNILLLSK